MFEYRKQRGVAALFYVLLLPPLFGIYALGTDGALMIQHKARMNDAIEAASLAVSALNDDGSDEAHDAQVALARTYVEQYMDTAIAVDAVNVVRTYRVDESNQRYFEYQVSATSSYDTLYPNAMDSSPATYSVAASGISGKYQGLPMDIMLVSDYSGSMGYTWDAENQVKYKMLVDVIESVTEEVARLNGLISGQGSTIGFVGFGEAVKWEIEKEECFFIWCWTVTEICPIDMLYLNYSQNGGSYVREINYEMTVKDDHLLYGHLETNRVHIPESERWCTSNNFFGSNFKNATFREIALEEVEPVEPPSKQPLVDTIEHFSPGGGTGSYQGVIRGTQLLHDGINPRKLLIILSDGKDEGTNKLVSVGHATIASQLYVTHSMCEKIRTGLDSAVAKDVDLGMPNTVDIQVQSKIAVIGFDYTVSGNTGLTACAGTENVYNANNEQEIIDTIIQLISEEIGHLKNKDE